MINPTAGLGTNQISRINPLGGANPLQNGGANPLAPAGDTAGLSPEAMQGPQGMQQMAQMLQSMMEAFGMGQQQQPTPEQRIQQLQQEIAVTEQQLAQAQQSGDEQQVQGLTQKLEALKAELAQLMGAQQGGEGGGAPAGGGGEGGGAPMGGGGGAPAGGGGGAPMGGGGDAGGGGGAPMGGGHQSNGGGNPVGSVSPSGDTQGVGSTGDVATVPPELAGDDAKMAEFIEGKLAGTPLAGKGLGSHFVAAGKKSNVDPLVLASISKHETNHGKLGVGPVKHMGVGAFDASPNKARKWDGEVNQIYSGARTFANLRSKYGSNANQPLSHQLRAVNGNGTSKGWASDSNWHNKVGRTYNQYASSARTSSTRVASSSRPSTSTRTASRPSRTSSSKKA